MITGMRTLLFACFTLLFIATPPAAEAQFSTNSFISPEIGIELKPEFPRPGETVTATLNDYGGNTYGSTITWLFNGEVVSIAENQRQATFIAGATDNTQTIEVVLNRPSGGREVLSTTIKPVYLDVVIEPQTRVPNWYQGRALPSLESQVNATALINGSADATNYVYTWRVNQQVLEGGSLRGRNQVSFSTPRGDELVLFLQVTDLRGNTIARRAVLVPAVQPELHFYEVSTLFGASQRAITDRISLIGNSTTVRAEPYYLDTRTYNNPDVKEWELGGRDIATSGNPYEITLQRTGQVGSTELNFHVRSLQQILQGAEDSIAINF